MNIISNCCAGGYLYRDYLKTQYPNPFIWSKIPFKDYYELMKHYKELNFNNIDIIRYKDFVSRADTKGITEWQHLTNVGIRIDNRVNVFYPHNYYSPADKTPRIVNCEVYYNKNYELTLNNWVKRITRSNITEHPIWVILTQANKKFTKDNTEKLLNDFKTENIVVITSFKDLLNLNTTNHRIYYNNNVERSPQAVLWETKINLNF